MGLFSSSSKSTTTTSLTDTSANATDNATANYTYLARANLGGDLIINDQKAGIEAIQSNERTILQLSKDAKDNLTGATDLVSNAFTKILSAAQGIADNANTQLNQTRDFAADAISKEQETADDRLIKTIMIFGAAILGGLWIMTKGVK